MMTAPEDTCAMDIQPTDPPKDQDDERNSTHGDTVETVRQRKEGDDKEHMADSNRETGMDIYNKEETNEDEIVGEQTKVDPALIDALTNGFLVKVLPDLESSKNMLEELMRNQRILIDTVQQENSKFDECQAFRELGQTLQQAKQYHAKLVNIKKDMNGLHEKSAKLKKRALKLQQQKQKEELHRAHQRDKEIEREKMLVAKPAAPGTSRQHSTLSTESTGSQQSDTEQPNPSYAQ